MGPSDPVNLQTGFCAQVSGGVSRLLNLQQQQQQRAAAGQRQSSRYADRALAADSPITTVSLLVTTCNAVVDEGVYAVSAGLQAKLAALGMGATPPPGSSPAPSPPPALFLSVRKHACVIYAWRVANSASSERSPSSLLLRVLLGSVLRLWHLARLSSARQLQRRA